MDKIILIGGGGHCRVVIDAILAGGIFVIEGIIDREEKAGEALMGVPVIGSDAVLSEIFAGGVQNSFIAAGSTGSPELRIRLAEKARLAGFAFPVIVHPRASVSSFSSIGAGTFVAPLAAVSANARIGSHCIINTGGIVEHDVVIGDFVHVAPGAVVNGGVSVGARTHIGAESVVIQGVAIGENTIIGAGSIVVHNIPDNVVAYGNPCKVMRQNVVR